MAAGVLAASALGLAPPANAADDPGEHAATIAVVGVASLQARPDLALLGIGVEVEAPSAAEALDGNSRRMQAVVAAVRAAGIEESEISTAQFSIQPVYERIEDDGGSHHAVRAYRVANLLQVETRQLETVAAVIDAAVEAGANRVDHVGFELSAAARADLNHRLIELAVGDAEARARQALGPLGYEVAGVHDMAITEPGVPSPLRMHTARVGLAMEAAPPVFAGAQEVRVSVDVTFLIQRN